MTAPVQEATHREWLGLAVLALPLLVLALDVSILYLAAPALSADLAASATEQLWILDSYGFLIAGFLLTMGTLGDRIGRRRLLLIGAAAFAVASVLAAFAPTAGALIAARAMLGIAGATLMPSTLALISTMFPDPGRRSFAIAVWMTTFSGGTAAGPIVGGLLLEHFWWGSVFLLGMPFMVLLLVLGPRLLPEHREDGPRRPVDLVSVALSLAAMLPVVGAVKHTAAHGPGLVTSAVLLAGVGAGVLFVRRQHRLADPMLDLTLFRRRAFVAAVALLFLGLLAMNGMNFLLPQFLQFVGGLDPLAAGIALLPIAVITVVGALATPAAAARWGRTPLLAGGTVLATLGAVGVALVAPTGAAGAVVALVGVTVLGVMPAGVLGTDLVVGSVPPARAGGAAAISETSGELGVALGVAALGSVLTAVYTARVGSTLPPEVATAASEGVAPATALAAQLPAADGAAVRDAALAAFAEGVGAVGWAAAALSAVSVVLVLTVLREPGSR